MRVSSITASNFRQLEDVHIVFPKPGANDLTVVVGKNGHGKTNLLNAINWCLYGDEPHLSENSNQLPRLNEGTLQRMEHGDHAQVGVEIVVEAEDGSSVHFRRTEEWEFGLSASQPVEVPSVLTVSVDDSDGGNRIIEAEHGLTFVERFVPEKIREFFFFDGERLDTYFQRATSEHIRHAVFDISQIGLLDTIHTRLHQLESEYRREAGKLNPRIEETRKKLNSIESQIKDVANQLEQANQDVAQSKERIAECRQELAGYDEIRAKQDEREHTQANMTEKKHQATFKHEEKRSLLTHAAQAVGILPAAHRLLATIGEMRDSGELAATYDHSLLERADKTGQCPLCRRILPSDDLRRVKDLLAGGRTDAGVAQELNLIQNSLQGIVVEARAFADTDSSLTGELTTLNGEIEEAQQTISGIDRFLTGYNTDRVSDLAQKQVSYERAQEQAFRRAGSLQTQLDRLQPDRVTAERDLEGEVGKEQKAGQVKQQLDFVSRSLSVLEEATEDIMNQTRERIETETSQIFLSLTWKKNTFGSVAISGDYNIDVVHVNGGSMRGSLGAAEHELLALAFTLAVHKTSGFDSPILIDTPVAKVSDQNRVNFASVLATSSLSKQVILLFTPSEYTPDIAAVLEPILANKLVTVMNDDETSTDFEVVTNGPISRPS